MRIVPLLEQSLDRGSRKVQPGPPRNMIYTPPKTKGLETWDCHRFEKEKNNAKPPLARGFQPLVFGGWDEILPLRSS